ncbi:MAG: hypothetical protein AABM29_06635 [Actinomycetota bacterium]
MRALPDSGLMVQLTRGRAWIAVLSVLLAGIVALNVVSLSLSASQGSVAQQARLLEQENSMLRARLAQRLSNDRVQGEAAYLGMASPAPGDISYRDVSGRALRLMVHRLAAGFGLGTSLVEAPVTPTTTTVPVVADTTAALPPAAAPPAPATETLTEPATTATTPPPTQPAPAAPAGGTGGGVSPG